MWRVYKRFKNVLAADKLQKDLASSSNIELIESLGDEAESVTEDLSTLIANFPLYQQSRSKYVVEVINLQVAAWCLACNPWLGKSRSCC